MMPRAEWLFPCAVSLHQLEEAIWLPGFWTAHAWKPVSLTEFRLTAIAMAVLAFVITYAAERKRRTRVASRLFFAFCVIMFFNALWHIAATIYLRTYAPGVVTAVLVVLPVTSYLLVHSRPIP